MGGAGVATSEITQYLLLLYSPYLNVQSGLRVTSSGSFRDAKCLLNDYFCAFSIFINLNFYSENGMHAHGKYIPVCGHMYQSIKQQYKQAMKSFPPISESPALASSSLATSVNGLYNLPGISYA